MGAHEQKAARAGKRQLKIAAALLDFLHCFLSLGEAFDFDFKGNTRFGHMNHIPMREPRLNTLCGSVPVGSPPELTNTTEGLLGASISRLSRLRERLRSPVRTRSR